MMKMMNPEVKVVRFSSEDVIATSGALYRIMSVDGTEVLHECENHAMHTKVTGIASSGKLLALSRYKDDGSLDTALVRISSQQFEGVTASEAEKHIGDWFYYDHDDGTSVFYKLCSSNSSN